VTELTCHVRKCVLSSAVYYISPPDECVIVAMHLIYIWFWAFLVTKFDPISDDDGPQNIGFI